MRKAIANFLHAMATRVYDADHRGLIEVHDEYDICRCRLEIVTDEYLHRFEATLIELPAGWRYNEHDISRSDTDRHRTRSHH